MTEIAHDFVSMQRNGVPHASIAGTNDAGGAWGTPNISDDYTTPWPVVNDPLTSVGNRPHYLFPGQWQTDNDYNYDHSITNYLEARDNCGGAMRDFVDVCNVNGSLDANTNSYRSNANGLEWQFGGVNPKSVPYRMHKEIEPNGWTNAFNPIMQPAPRIAGSNAQAWEDSMYQGGMVDAALFSYIG